MDFSILKNMFPNMTDEELQAKAAEVAPEAQPDYTSLARESVMNKYGIGKYSPQEREKLTTAVNEANSPILSAISGFGAGLRGQDNMAAAQKFNEMAQSKAKQNLANFDLGRKTSMEDYGFGRQMTKDEREDKEYADKKDPASERSKAAQQMLVDDFGLDPALVGKMTAEQIEARIPTMTAKLDREFKKSEAEANRDFRRQEMSERRADRALQREIAQGQRDLMRQDKLEKESRPSEKQVKEFTDFDNALDSIKSIRAQKGSQDTGPLSALQNKVAGFVGMDDAEKSAFKSQVNDQLAQYIKSISGGAVSDQERAFLIQNIPTVSDNDETFNKKLDVLEQRLERNRQNAITNANKMGKNVKEFERTSNIKTSFPMQVRKDGKVATVNSQSELDEAKNEGWQ